MVHAWENPIDDVQRLYWPMIDDEINYGTLKQYAKDNGHRVNDLIVLAPQNDPFYAGTPGDWEMARWFEGLWNAFYQGHNMHIRRVHYQIISQDPPIVLPNGLPYENTERCWDYLNQASKMARYLNLVNPGAFNDRRNPDPVVFASYEEHQPEVRTRLGLWQSDLRLPSFPNLPTYSISDFEAEQGYHLELWCEKSTMNDVLLPLCRRYGMVLQTGLGELSITAAVAALDREEEYASFWYVWSQVGLTLEVLCLHRHLREEELEAVWHALVEAQYPGYEEALGYGGMEVPYVC